MKAPPPELTTVRETFASAKRRMEVMVAVVLLPLIVCCCLSCTQGDRGLDAAAVAANNRGVALMGQFEFEAARRVFQELAQKYPDNAHIQANLAVATLNRQEEGDEQRALSILRQVLESDPGNLRALYCRGLLELHMGRPAEALEYFQRVLEADPDDVDASYFVGKCLMQLSRYAEALSFFQRSIEGDPYLASAYYGTIMALRSLGKRDEAVAMIKEFQRLKDNPRGRLLEFKYRKMGRKGEVLAVGLPKTVEVEKPAGPVFDAPKPLVKHGQSMRWSEGLHGTPTRSSITTCDINGDGHLDVFIARALETPGGAGNGLLLDDAVGGGYTLDRQNPLSSVGEVNAALWGDMDNDGLTDVYLCRRGPNQLWRQIEKGVWRDVTEATQTAAGALDTVDGALFDADHDGDLDIFLVNADGPNELLNNDRDGTFRPLAADYGLSGKATPSKSVVTADLDGDRDVDLIVLNERPPHEVYRNELFWKYRAAKGLEAFVSSDVVASVAGDVDADGRVEIYALNSAGALTRWNRGGDGAWQGVALEGVPEDSTSGPSGRARLALADVDGDGAPDVIVSGPRGWWAASLKGAGLETLWVARDREKAEPATWAILASEGGPQLVGWTPGGPPFLWPPGSGRYPFASFRLSGLEDKDASMRSNASGIGARLSIRVGSRWTVMDTFRDSSGPGQGLQPVMAGLGGADRVDFVAIDWSDGVFQTELDLKAGALHQITETQRQLSSCPVLFAWNGKGYQFISDLLGVGGMGYALGPRKYAEPRPRESLVLPRGLPRPRDGRLIVKLTEPMEEATYLDAIRLVAYDLPPGWSMTLDERMGISEPAPTGRPIFYRKLMTPLRAVNDRGEDVTAAVAQRDLRGAPPGELDHRFIGRLKRDHVVTLVFPEALDRHPGQAILLADGWVEYPYSQTNFAAWQAGADYRAPTVEARGSDGRWHMVLEQFGYPAGMPRQMSVPLPRLPGGARELRISTNQEIYWDRLAVAFAEPCPEVERQEFALARAQLEYIGFPRRSDGAQRLPRYDFRRRQPLWDTRLLEGYHTRFGPVEALVGAKDGALAIFGPGEAIHLEFHDAARSLRTGWSRIHVIEADGWCKDMDLYTLDGDTVEPLPTFGERAPRSERLHQVYNTRYLSGRQ